jgi:hypothetical protein
MGALLIELLAEGVELALLSGQMGCRRVVSACKVRRPLKSAAAEPGTLGRPQKVAEFARQMIFVILEEVCGWHRERK